MKIFVDSGDPREVERAFALGFVDGVTTNPTSLTGDFHSRINRLHDIMAVSYGPVSFQLLGPTYSDFMREAHNVLGMVNNPHNRLVIKLPCTIAGYRVSTELSQRVFTNLTLCFNPGQAILAAKSGASYISPFMGRLDDVGRNSMNTLAQIISAVRAHKIYKDSEILASSIRSVDHFLGAVMLGADALTAPFKVLVQLADDPLTSAGVEKFLKDVCDTNKS